MSHSSRTPDVCIKPRPHQQQRRSNTVEATLSSATSRTILSTKSKQIEHVQFVSTLSKESFDLRHSTMLLRHCCSCGRGLTLVVINCCPVGGVGSRACSLVCGRRCLLVQCRISVIRDPWSLSLHALRELELHVPLTLSADSQSLCSLVLLRVAEMSRYGRAVTQTGSRVHLNDTIPPAEIEL